MGTLTISLTSTPLTASKSYTVSDADVTSLINYLQGRYVTNVPQQAMLAWVNDWLQKTINDVQRANVVAPPPISIS